MAETTPTTMATAPAATQQSVQAAQQSAQHQETQRAEAAKQRLADDKEVRQKQNEQRERVAKGKPTPTQDELNRFALGEHIKEHEDDGSGPDPFDVRAQAQHQKKQQSK